MGPDALDIEVERSEEEIRADKVYNVKEYFESKKSGTNFTPIDVKTTKRVSVGRELRNSYDRVEHYIKDENNLYSDEVKSSLDRIKTFMDLFLR